MKNLLIASIATLALATGAAQAADMAMPVKAPIAPAPVWSWTGFYFGGGFGYGVADLSTTPLNGAGPMVGTIDNGAKGWTGQVKAGFDYQFGATPFGNIVGGVFADWDPSSMRGNFSTGLANGFNSPLDGQEKINSSWAVGGRIGYLVTPTVLTYFNGGYTNERLGGVNAASFGIPAIPGNTITSGSRNQGGWFTGGGFEAPVTIIPIKGLFFYTEYRYSVFNTSTVPVVTTGAFGGLAPPTGLNVKTSVQTVVSGIDYRFNWH
jgi:outer membrane immunogenic protein